MNTGERLRGRRERELMALGGYVFFSRKLKILQTQLWWRVLREPKTLALWNLQKLNMEHLWKMKPGLGATTAASVTGFWCLCRVCDLTRGVTWLWPCLPGKTSTAASIAPLSLLSGTSKLWLLFILFPKESPASSSVFCGLTLKKSSPNLALNYAFLVAFTYIPHCKIFGHYNWLFIKDCTFISSWYNFMLALFLHVVEKHASKRIKIVSLDK